MLCVWYARKASYGIIAIGLILGSVVGRADQLTIAADTPDQFWDQLRSPLAGVILGLAVRVGASFVALALAFPLARAREAGLPPRAYLGNSLTGILDRLHAARAYRSLRWTHHVRQVALARLGATGRRIAHLDPIMDAAKRRAPRDCDRRGPRAWRITRLSSSAAERRERPSERATNRVASSRAMRPLEQTQRILDSLTILGLSWYARDLISPTFTVERLRSSHRTGRRTPA